MATGVTNIAAMSVDELYTQRDCAACNGSNPITLIVRFAEPLKATVLYY